MTTNVFDGPARIVATDSRWSWPVIDGRWFVYLDDTGFDKIQVLNDLVVMYAGDGQLVQAWRDYFADEARELAAQPTATKEVCVCVVDAETGVFVKSAGGDYEVFEDSLFGGTGGGYARKCWATNRKATRAVETAKAEDRSSGGEVKYVDIVNKDGNVKPVYPSELVTIQSVNLALYKRGVVMDLRKNVTVGGEAVPFELAAAAHAELAEFGQQVVAGQVSPSAPFAGMNREWTTAEKEGLNDALRKYGWK
jgi:hypothetical protein